MSTKLLGKSVFFSSSLSNMVGSAGIAAAGAAAAAAWAGAAAFVGFAAGLGLPAHEADALGN